MHARPIRELIEAFARLPGVGPRTAERYVFALLKSGRKDTGEILLALKHVMEDVKSCTICWTFSDQSPCALCSDQRRDQSRLCIVAEPSDIESIEHTKTYLGRYHVLRGTIDVSDEATLSQIKIAELLDRLPQETHIQEIILALSPDVAGETTMMYLEQELKRQPKKYLVSRLAKGLPMGSDLRYADDITLANALAHRIQI